MDTGPTAASEFGAFLRSRRERTRPEDLGLEPGSRRKVEGLRREEVAALAGLGTDYYERLEQGRNIRLSDTVIDSIADALDLDDIEHRHLTTLARMARQPTPPVRRRPDRVPENTRVMLSAMTLLAFVVSRHLDVLARNDLAVGLLGDPLDVTPNRRNVLFTLFADDDSRLHCQGWKTMAMDYIGMFRNATAHDPEDPRSVAIVGELSIQSDDFRRL